MSTKFEGSIDVAISFIGSSQNSFFNGVIVLPIGDSTCPHYLCSGNHTKSWYPCSVFHTVVNTIVRFHQKEMCLYLIEAKRAYKIQEEIATKDVHHV